MGAAPILGVSQARGEPEQTAKQHVVLLPFLEEIRINEVYCWEGMLENIAMGPSSRGVGFPLADDGSSTTSLSWGAAGSCSQLQPLLLRIAAGHSGLQMDQ